MKIPEEGDLFNFVCLSSDNSFYHYFNGYLITKKNLRGILYFQDTAYGKFPDWDNSINSDFTIEEIEENGSLEFVCNLNKIKEVTDLSFYKKDDLIELKFFGKSRFFILT